MYILKPFPEHRHIYAPFDAVVAFYTICNLLVLKMWFGSLFKAFRSVSLDLTGYVYNYDPLEASKFVC